jgi:hypothetical protein
VRARWDSHNYGIADPDLAVIEDFLEFHGCFGASVCGQLSFAANTARIEAPNNPGMLL